MTDCGDFLVMAIEIARWHHERFDGTGYPHGLKGNLIPLSARIVSVADVFDALTSKRVYKNAIHVERASSMIEEESGKHFDPAVVSAFCRKIQDLVDAKLAVDSGNDSDLTPPPEVCFVSEYGAPQSAEVAHSWRTPNAVTI